MEHNDTMDGLPVLTVRVIVRTDEEQPRFALLQRLADADRDPAAFELPGGKIDPGESAVVTAEREAQEELGVEVLSVESLVLDPITFELGAGNQNYSKRSHLSVELFSAVCPSPNQARHSQEHGGLAWWTTQEIDAHWSELTERTQFMLQLAKVVKRSH